MTSFLAMFLNALPFRGKCNKVDIGNLQEFTKDQLPPRSPSKKAVAVFFSQSSSTIFGIWVPSTATAFFIRSGGDSGHLPCLDNDDSIRFEDIGACRDSLFP